MHWCVQGKIQFGGSIDKLKLRIWVRGYLHNKELVVDTWSPTACMRTLKYFLSDTTKHKARVHQLDFIAAFLQAKVKNRVFVKFDGRYIYYFSEYTKYFGKALRLLNSMSGMTNSGKLFADKLTEWLLKLVLSNLRFRCLSIISMHHNEQIFLSYLMLMNVSIGILLKLLENGLSIL